MDNLSMILDYIVFTEYMYVRSKGTNEPNPKGVTLDDNIFDDDCD